jgi:hypothetical protein
VVRTIRRLPTGDTADSQSALHVMDAPIRIVRFRETRLGAYSDANGVEGVPASRGRVRRRKK